jgi:hypothetical protein
VVSAPGIDLAQFEKKKRKTKKELVKIMAVLSHFKND